jgi:hypothetical protein
MRKILIITAALASSCALAESNASNRLTLPLPSEGKVISVAIGKGIQLVAQPQPDGWEIRATDQPAQSFPPNLLYHSRQWHGPYPNQIYAWHLLKGYFPNTRWLCVSGHPIELKLQILNAKVRPEGEVAVFESGQLSIEWFHRPCTRGFGYERLAPNKSLQRTAYASAEFQR